MQIQFNVTAAPGTTAATADLPFDVYIARHGAQVNTP